MKIIFRTTALFMLLLSVAAVSFGQYFGEQVMEKSFEQTDFFFTPDQLIPFGIGAFRNSVPGVLNDPLLNLGLNPAYLYGDTSRSSYFYLDLRSAKEIRDSRNVYFPYPVLTERPVDIANILPYPRFFVATRKGLEPAFSAAYLVRPTEGALRKLSLGATYQLVSQDEPYYPIPQDIYKAVLGSDYMGVRSAGTENIPIVDRYNGTDNIHQEGHFVSLFAGYEIAPDLQVGAKLGRISFNREGSLGSQNLWDNYYGVPNTSLWRNTEARNQSYGHWELAGGINYTFGQNYSAGLSGGHLWGDADQALTRDDSSYYGYGPIGSTLEDWSVYSSSGVQRQSWLHDGRTSYGGINVRAKLNDAQLLQLHYQYVRQHTDIGLDGIIEDTSYGMSRYASGGSVNTYLSDDRLFDRRNGAGLTVGDIHRAIGSLQWDLGPTVKLSLGVRYENTIVNTTTTESVIANRHSRYSSGGTNPYAYFDSAAESKTVAWAFRSKLTTLTIPIFFTIRTSRVVELIFGLSRSASTWAIDDMSLALYDYRVQANQQGATRMENFGERYTQPPERVSDVRTALLAGVTVAPSNEFSVQLLVVPNFVDTYTGSELSDVQGWISVKVFP